MVQDKILPDTKKFFLGLILGVLIGCVLGQCSTIFSSTSNTSNFIATEAIASNIMPTVNIEPTSTFAPTFTHTPTITQTPFSTLKVTPEPSFLIIPYTVCGDHVAYSAEAETTEIPIIENDKIIEYATYVLVTYRIKNTYVNTPIYGFEIRPSPGYTNPALYPHKSQMFDGDPLIQPNEEVILKSEHLFVPDSWSFDEHTNAYWKFPENLRFHPYPYESAIGGYTVTFQIFELFNFSKLDELRCDGAMRTK